MWGGGVWVQRNVGWALQSGAATWPGGGGELEEPLGNRWGNKKPGMKQRPVWGKRGHLSKRKRGLFVAKMQVQDRNPNP